MTQICIRNTILKIKLEKYNLEHLRIIIDVLRLGIPWRKVDKLANIKEEYIGEPFIKHMLDY